MKSKFKWTWALVVIFVIANLFIFKFMSKKLESVVINKIVTSSEAEVTN